VPAGSDDVVTLSPGPLMIRESTALAVTESLSVTLTVKLDGPGVAGVPEIVPPVRLSPAASDPPATDHM